MTLHWTTPLKLAAREMPGGFTVSMRYEEWLLYAWHLKNDPNATDDNEGDTMGTRSVTPFQVMELERNAARSENKALTMQLQQLQQQANNAIQQFAAANQQMKIFVAALAHAMGGKIHVPHASLDAVRSERYSMKEDVDNELKVTVVELVKAEEQPPTTTTDEQQSSGSEREASVPVAEPETAPPSLIEVVSR